MKTFICRLFGCVLLAVLAYGTARADVFRVEVRTFTEGFQLRLAPAAEYDPASGSLDFSVPDGVRTTIRSGRATMAVKGTEISGDAGDTFSFLVVDGQPHIVVHSGEMGVTLPGYMMAVVRAGQFLPVSVSKLGGFAAAAPAGTPGAKVPQAQAPTVPQAQAPTVPARPEGTPPAGSRSPGAKLKVRIHPHYSVVQSYDSNIYRVPKDKADGSTVGGGVLGSWITRNTAGSRLVIPFNKRHRFEAVYDFSIENYSTQPGTNDTSDQNVNASYLYDVRRDVTLRLSDRYVNTEVPAFSELVTRKRRYENIASAELDYRRNRLFTWGLDVKYSHHKYLDPALATFLNRYESSFGGRAGIKLRPKSELYLHYHRGIIHYSAGRGNHSKSHEFGLGLSGEITPRLQGMVSSGVGIRRYERPSVGEKQTANLLAANVNLSYQMFRRTRVDLGGYRRFQEATFGSSRYYVSTGGSLTLAQHIKTLIFSVSGGHETNQYPVSTQVGGASAFRRDRAYTGSAGLELKVRKWLSCGARYTHARRLTSFSEEFDYRADMTSLSLRAEF